MYGLKGSNETLAFLIGKEICQVCIGSWDVQFNWGNRGISVWSRFVYKAASGDEIIWTGGNPEGATPVVRLLNSSITSVEIYGPKTLRLRFSNGDQLDIIDDDERYEAFSICDGKNPIIIV